jgi:enoyl reductase-like protein
MTVFSLPREKRGSWLQEHRVEVIQRLNADYFKPWFPAKKDGQVVEDLGDITYKRTVLRLVRLMYVTHEERFTGVNGGGHKGLQIAILQQPRQAIHICYHTNTSFFE